MTLESESTIGEGIREYELDHEVTIYDPQSQQALVLNATATGVWRLADGSLTEVEIAQRVAEPYGKAAAEVADEVRSLLDQLTELGVLDQRDPPRRRS